MQPEQISEGGHSQNSPRNRVNYGFHAASTSSSQNPRSGLNCPGGLSWCFGCGCGGSICSSGGLVAAQPARSLIPGHWWVDKMVEETWPVVCNQDHFRRMKAQ